MTLAERISEIDAIADAILAGRSNWPVGLWDAGLKRLESSAEVLTMTDDELVEFSSHYQQEQNYLGPTSGALMIEIARRSTLSAHRRVAEAKERSLLIR